MLVVGLRLGEYNDIRSGISEERISLYRLNYGLKILNFDGKKDMETREMTCLNFLAAIKGCTFKDV